ELLDNVERLYFHIDGHGSEKVHISLYLPPKIIRSITNNVQYISNTIDEFITFDVKFSEIVLEQITNETIPGTEEVYNPSCVIKDDFAAFKIEVAGENFNPEMVTWLSKKGKVQFLNGAGELTDQGNGLITEVKGMRTGEDTLMVMIDGYDGRPPEVHISVVELKNLDVYTHIVKNILGESAFTDEEIDGAFEVANQIMKQIGVRLNRKPLDFDNDANPNQNMYYELESAAHLHNLIDMKRIEEGEGVEVYFVKGQKFDRGMIGEAYYNRGTVITRYGFLDPLIPEDDVFTPHLLAHEILHSMRKNRKDRQQVFDIYTEVRDAIGQEVTYPSDVVVNDTLIPLDWGTGYYRKNSTQEEIIRRLLMFGTNEDGRRVIPRGTVHGLDINTISAIHVKCGGIVELKERYFAHDQ
ncbi:hypothetical protein QA601_18635, partial [Chitinispirillales bacterium ANBcel5]|uniref:hypothetical protein n=1 Tax=Cellulosispirillum alkaliphilum TaxID=3039283 RepID=UPI002A506826|nr:hypothetical protein [Chitinispirillales bacterium ANBcel5]